MDDEMNDFFELDNVNYTNVNESLIDNNKDFVCPVLAFLDENILTLQSLKVFDCIYGRIKLKRDDNLHRMAKRSRKINGSPKRENMAALTPQLNVTWSRATRISGNGLCNFFSEQA